MALDVNTALIFAYFACIIVTVFLLASTIMRCRSEKKNIFVFCLFTILLYVAGAFFEVSAQNTGEVFMAIKVMYAGACFMSPLFLLFTLDYCEVRIGRGIGTLLIGVSLANMLLVWTTDRTHLVYESFEYSDASAIHGLVVHGQGPFYYLLSAVGAVCIAISIVLLVKRYRSWGAKYRKSLILLTLVSVGPLAANFAYIFMTYFTPGDERSLNLTSFVLVATTTAFYYGVLRYDLFDFTTRARSMTVDLSADAVIVLDAYMNFSAANDAAVELFPFLADISKGCQVGDREDWPEQLREIELRQGLRDIDFMIPSEDGDRYYQARLKPFARGDEDISSSEHALGVVLIIRDVTTRYRLMAELEEAAYTDGLTGLYNRRHFMELAAMTLARARRMGTPCSILIFDIDHFKDVNDTFGHLAGDEVLRSMGRRLRSTVRAYDLFARYGGEEFIALLDGAVLKDAERLAERIRRQIEASVVRYEHTDINITCSVGVAEVGPQDGDIDDVLRRADEALYRAKDEGRNRVCVADAEAG